MKTAILFLIFAILITVDKGITIANVVQANKYFPEAMKDDIYKIEKNPVAKFFFQKLGLAGGSLVYWIISMITLFVAFGLLSLVVGNRIALYIVVLLYGLVIANNFYFLFKYSGLIT